MKTIFYRMNRWVQTVVAAGVLTSAAVPLLADSLPTGAPVPRQGLSLRLWAREPMLRNPVALSLDDQGRLYVVETARRSTVDIDIRSHPTWLLEDLANETVDDLRAFFRRKMAPELSAENARWLPDRNGDGSHDWRDLMEVRERVHLLEDSSGLGRADRATVFAEGFNEEISGVIVGVLPW
jgi:quinoprotein glucose dehydrogenase